jgi:hypothetical protein
MRIQVSTFGRLKGMKAQNIPETIIPESMGLMPLDLILHLFLWLIRHPAALK